MKRWKYIFALLVLAGMTVWIAFFTYPEPKLHLIACDVGQGDAILAVYGKNQILVDGGKGRGVLDCLDRHIPFWDRRIELVILTHPQVDHFGGLIEVFKSYGVDTFVTTSLDSGSQEYKVLENTVGGSGASIVTTTTGMVIRLGLLYLDIVWPTADFIGKETIPTDKKVLGKYTSNRDPNDFSVVAILRLKEFDALLTGDIGPKVTDEILETGLVGDVEYIKVPHHGSKNGLSGKLVEISSPEVAVISVGKDNWYGHPHKEVLEMLEKEGVKLLRTDKRGDIKIITDGEVWQLSD